MVRFGVIVGSAGTQLISPGAFRLGDLHLFPPGARLMGALPAPPFQLCLGMILWGGLTTPPCRGFFPGKKAGEGQGCSRRPASPGTVGSQSRGAGAQGAHVTRPGARGPSPVGNDEGFMLGFAAFL